MSLRGYTRQSQLEDDEFERRYGYNPVSRVPEFYRLEELTMAIGMTDEQRAEIDAMDHLALARLWRFGKSENPLLQGEAGRHVKHRLFKTFSGFTPEISKLIGWG